MNLSIECFQCGPLEENCYLIWSKTGEKRCWLIDCGAFLPIEVERIVRFIEEKGLKLKKHLLTHGHFDHIFGAQAIFERFGIGPSMLEEELTTYTSAPDLMRMLMPVEWELSTPPVQEILTKRQTMQLDEEGKICFHIIQTPGHTPGGCCYYCETEGILISGDTMFQHSCGRTDFPGGSERAMRESLTRLLELPEGTRVLPGHGPSTTIGEEQAWL